MKRKWHSCPLLLRRNKVADVAPTITKLATAFRTVQTAESTTVALRNSFRWPSSRVSSGDPALFLFLNLLFLPHLTQLWWFLYKHVIAQSDAYDVMHLRCNAGYRGLCLCASKGFLVAHRKAARLHQSASVTHREHSSCRAETNSSHMINTHRRSLLTSLHTYFNQLTCRRHKTFLPSTTEPYNTI